jgi:hypothetical protein
MADEQQPCTDDNRPVACLMQLDRMEKKLDELHKLMTGNSEPHKGVIVRMDRLEQRSRATLWFVNVVLGALITAVVAGTVAAILALSGGTP